MATVLSAAYDAKDAALVRRAAASLGLTPSAFLRKVSVARAKLALRVVRLRKAGIKTNTKTKRAA